MALILNNHLFKGHRALLGSRFATYGVNELASKYAKKFLKNVKKQKIVDSYRSFKELLEAL